MIEETGDEALFESLMKEYQGLDIPTPDLTAAVDRGHRKLVRGMAIGFVISAGLATAGLTRMILDPRPSSFVFGLMEIGFPAVTMAFVIWSQRKAWSARAVSTRAFLVLELERRRDELRRTLYLLFSCPVLGALTLLFQILLGLEHPIIWTVGVLPVIGIATPYVILVAVLWRAIRKRRKLFKEVDDCVRRINELDDAKV